MKKFILSFNSSQAAMNRIIAGTEKPGVVARGLKQFDC
jgi:hypothetical protein